MCNSRFATRTKEREQQNLRTDQKDIQPVVPSFIVNTSLTRGPIRLRAFKPSSDALRGRQSARALKKSRLDVRKIYDADSTQTA